MLRHTANYALWVSIGLIAACGHTNEQPGPGPGDSPVSPVGPDSPTPGVFESDNPGASVGEIGRAPASEAAFDAPPTATGTPGTANGGDTSAADDSGARAIEEADIIKIEDGKLYALSRYGGLSVVDVGTRDRLKLLGRHKIVATPFEMYVRGGLVFALYQNLSEYAYDEDAKQWLYYQTSEVVVLDARDPASISVLDRFAVPGNINDSRIVGDILYVAAFENGYCYGCEREKPRTVVVSLDVSNPAEVKKVDEVSRDEREGSYSWKRSLTATDQRLYLAGPTWSNSEYPVGSTIEVFDISDPSGDIAEGASVQVNGQIQSRWQMDEYEGVLRTVSQPFQWALTTPPRVETFRVTSATEVTPLGSTVVTLPKPEVLQSARFDGPRGYVVTAERTDPLFTFDLSDPAAPKQRGELEMPGWLYHMEPRGDRLLGLGYDQNNAAGAITVSLFDVSDLGKPTMLERVNFGGDWASLPEDQDRIHKAFNVLDSAGLILVPFSGYSYVHTQAPECGRAEYVSGVQLVDFAEDALALRGVAPSRGAVRRGFVVDERLLTMSDERVESFDISNRDTPKTTASLPLAQFVNRAEVAGEAVVRVGQNWWTGSTELDVTTLANAASLDALAKLEIPEREYENYEPAREGVCYSKSTYWLSDVYANEDATYFFHTGYAYDPVTQKERQSTRIVTVDVSDPKAPAIAADAVLDFAPAYPNYVIGAVPSGASTVNVGKTFVSANRTYRYTGDRYAVETSEFKVVDLRDPAEPAVATVSLPETFGATGLVVSGPVVATSQFQTLNADQSRVRFYLERVDVSNPAAPVLAPSVNIPGSLLAYDARTERALTVDYRIFTAKDVTEETCYSEYGSYAFAHDDPTQSGKNVDALGTCRAIQQTLHLVQISGAGASILDSYELEFGELIGNTAVGEDRIFIALRKNNGFVRGGPAIDVASPAVGLAYYGFGFESGKADVLTLNGLGKTQLSVGRVEVETGNYWYGSGPIVAAGTRAALSAGFQGKLSVIDASDTMNPKLAKEIEVPGYVSDLDVAKGTVIASLGQDGIVTIPLTE